MKSDPKITFADEAMVDATKYPPECFSLARDRRKWRHLCFRRRALFIQLARHSNADGPNVFPGVDKLAGELGWSRATAFRFLEDLRELGCVVNETTPNGTHKKTSYRGTAVRRLVFNKLPPPGSSRWHTLPDGSVQREFPGVTDSPAVESQIQKSASQIHDSESQIHGRKPTQCLTWVLGEYFRRQGKLVSFGMGTQKKRLEGILEGYTEDEVRSAVRRAVSSGEYDGLKSGKIRSKWLTDDLSRWLPKMREEEAERARQIITPRDGS